MNPVEYGRPSLSPRPAEPPPERRSSTIFAMNQVLFPALPSRGHNHLGRQQWVVSSLHLLIMHILQISTFLQSSRQCHSPRQHRLQCAIAPKQYVNGQMDQPKRSEQTVSLSAVCDEKSDCWFKLNRQDPPRQRSSLEPWPITPKQQAT